MRFCNPFIKLVMQCVTTASLSLLFEGEVTNRFYSRCNLRQGDLLSPVLFNLLMESLSQGIHLAKRLQKLNNYKLDGVNSVSYLLFTDDVLVFTKVNTKSLHVIKDVIHDFSSLVCKLNFRRVR